MEFEQALDIILNSVKPQNAEICDLDHALGRVLAQDITSKVTLPMYNSSFKDGFAVRYDEVKNAHSDNSIQLSVKGESFAGSCYQKVDFPKNSAAKITTGAYLPQGLDTVVPWEDAKVKDGFVYIDKAPRKNQDITLASSELNTGELILRRGLKLKPADIGLAAASGNAEFMVAQIPRVGIISTGNELVMPGNELNDGQIYSSNQFQLKTQIRQLYMKSCAIIIKDDFDLTEQGIAKLLLHHDVLISSGSSADSEKDFMGRVLNKLGWDMLINHTHIKPGHTLKYGLLQGKPFFVLPGTPSGTEICFNLFVIPLLRKLTGQTDVLNTIVYATLTDHIKGSPKIKTVSQVVLSFEHDGRNTVSIVSKNCGRIKSIAKKNALIIVPSGGYNKGDVVEVILV